MVTSAAFAPDGRTLVTAGLDGTAVLWDITGIPPRLGRPLAGHVGLVTSVAFVRNILTTVGSDGTAIRWDVTDRARPRQLGSPRVARGGLTMSLGSSHDGHTQVTEMPDGTAILWDVTDRLAGGWDRRWPVTMAR